MAIEFTNLVGDWRRIVEDYVTDPANAADAPGVEGTITVTPLLGEGRHAPRGVPSGGVFYTFAPLDLRVYRGLLMDENMNSDITVAIEVDGYPIAWRASFDLQYRRIKIPLQDVIFGPNEIVGGQISLSSLVARDGVPAEYEGSYVQLMDAVASAAQSAQDALDAASGVPAALAGKADLVDGLVPESQLPELGAPGVMVTDSTVPSGVDPVAGDSAVALGYRASAVGEVATAVGHGASADAGSLALGYSATASESSTAVGGGASAVGACSTSVGTATSATGDFSAALGFGAQAPNHFSAALGYGAQAPNHFQITLGGHFPGENGDPTYQHEVHVPGVLVLYSPDRSMWAITVDNTGTISATPWTPPDISPM